MELWALIYSEAKHTIPLKTDVRQMTFRVNWVVQFSVERACAHELLHTIMLFFPSQHSSSQNYHQLFNHENKSALLLCSDRESTKSPTMFLRGWSEISCEGISNSKFRSIIGSHNHDADPICYVLRIWNTETVLVGLDVLCIQSREGKNLPSLCCKCT